MTNFQLKGKKIWVAGHRGMVGQALLRRLETENAEVLTVDRKNLDLRDEKAVQTWMKEHSPDVVLLAAAKVGGILANSTYPAEFLHDNLTIASNVIHASSCLNVSKLLFLGSSCIYPKFASQPIVETALLSGSLEPSNQWYALAKIVGVKMVEAYALQYGKSFISVMPTNLYGVNDTYHLLNSHVIPALIMKIHAAKTEKRASVEIWGSGNVRREFLYVDDLADACIFLLKNYDSPQTINVGVGEDLSIRDLAHQIGNVIGFHGEFVFDTKKPEGTPQKLLDVSRMNNLGWRPQVSLEAGLKSAYQDYLKRNAE
ncbi:MAG: GDP-fucose synthetase [Alphaproteobacteria bacterium 16-39-46]|nr:MAG: GDP-fucose synthetase [Alphaproteobacteria bacterium 16-39-46]OZA41647.1 MAG: GDP-fucose synthetase [Alphaproteobacteria bacterium 17-39-52]HQS84756.1 GDP-L-fucose synthase [Alphaproteobacteria bacterium]HQS94568.1 GDP-L-fucose synthase [Alphaproteobacteria bacterium]